MTQTTQGLPSVEVAHSRMILGTQSESSELRKRHLQLPTTMVPHIKEMDVAPEISLNGEDGIPLQPITPGRGDSNLPNKTHSRSGTLINGTVPLTNLECDEEDGRDDQVPLIESSAEDGERGRSPAESETYLSIGLQVLFPYLIAGLGMVGAGMVLDIVQHWDVFKVVSEVFILVPALLGLKGNLEMTLASRLSTQANLGTMDDRKEKMKMIGGNLALIQCQATVVALLASLVAVILGWIPDGVFDVQHAFLLCASSLVTASLASAVLGGIMVAVILVSRRCKINPDNVATPIAASLGDLVTLSLLAGVSNLLFQAIGKQHWLAPVIIAFFVLLLPLWIYISNKNTYTCEVLLTGWTPVIAAMAISSAGGFILDYAVSRFSGIAVFQPVINGVGGNLVAVQASRLSTTLHKQGVPGQLPRGKFPSGCPNSCSTFCGKDDNSKTSRVLLALVVPGHLVFVYTIAYVNAGHTSVTPVFSAVYLTAALIQVIILLYVANWMVHYMWRKETDPDNAAIPYLTALGDLLGTGLLAGAFLLLFTIGDKDSDVGE